MSDPFSLPPIEQPPRFEDAVRGAVERLQVTAAEFDRLAGELPEDCFTEEEWRIIELAASDIENSADMLDEGYVAVAFDGHAWYRIIEHLERVANRLDSALGIMRAARARRPAGPE
jgi:hypothetical protein